MINIPGASGLSEIMSASAPASQQMDATPLPPPTSKISASTPTSQPTNPATLTSSTPAKSDSVVLQSIEFTYFPKLPLELRRKIWDQAILSIRGQAVTIEPSCNGSVPRVLHVNLESREQALKTFARVERPATKSNGAFVTFINYDKDTLYIGARGLYANPQEEHVSFGGSFYHSEAFPAVKYDNNNFLYSIETYADILKNVKLLIVKGNEINWVARSDHHPAFSYSEVFKKHFPRLERLGVIVKPKPAPYFGPTESRDTYYMLKEFGALTKAGRLGFVMTIFDAKKGVEGA